MSLSLFLTIFIVGIVSAKEKCSVAEVTGKICELFEKNKEKPFLKTSSGESINNPRYQKPKAPEDSLITSIETVSDEVDREVDNQLNFRVEVADLMQTSAPKNWSTKTRVALSEKSSVRAILITAYPADPSINSGYTEARIPTDFQNPDSKYDMATQEQLKLIVQSLGTKNIEKLKSIYLNYNSSKLDKGQSITAKVEPKQSESKRTELHGESSQDRQKRLFKSAQESIKEMIKQGRKDSDLTPEQQNLITRIEGIKLHVAESEKAKFYTSCLGDDPQASYMRETHEVVICKSALNLTDANLVYVIGHEIGHSIDPCTASGSIFKKVSNPKDSDNISPEDRNTFQTYLQNKQETFWDYRPLVAEKLTKNGYAMVINKGIAVKDHPFNSIRSCLRTTANIDIITNRDIEMATDLHLNTLKRRGIKVDAKLRKEIRQNFLTNPECTGTDIKKSEMNEAMSDVYGSYSLAKYQKENPPKSLIDIAAANMIYLSSMCHGDFRKDLSREVSIQDLHRKHPETLKRQFDILFSFPGVLSHIDCQVQPTNNCFQQFNSFNNLNGNSKFKISSEQQIEGQK